MFAILFVLRNVTRKRTLKKIFQDTCSIKHTQNKEIHETNNIRNNKDSTFHPKNYTKKVSMWDSPVEREIYHQLLTLNTNNINIIPHVSLAELFISHIYERRDWKITQSHVDFLICDKYSLAPLIAIEFDGRYHNDINQKKRDAEKNYLFEYHNIKLVRFTYEDYKSGELLNRIIKELKYLNKVYCAECGNEMTLYPGKDGLPDFFGCNSFKETNCRYKREKGFTYI